MQVGICNPLPENETAEILAALADLEGEPAEIRKFDPLGGPNDVVQLLETALGWATFIKATGWYLDKLLAPTATRQGEWLRDNWSKMPELARAKAQRLASAFTQARKGGRITTVGIAAGKNARFAAIEITSDEPEKIAFAAALVAHNARNLTDFLNDPPIVGRLGAPGRNALEIEQWVESSTALKLSIDEHARLYIPLEFWVPSDQAPGNPWHPRILRLYMNNKRDY